MASLWQKTLFYLGLVDDEQAEAVDGAAGSQQAQVRTVAAPERRTPPPRTERPAPRAETPGPTYPSQTVAGRRVEPPDRQRRRMSADPQHAEAGVIVRSGGASRAMPPVAEDGEDAEVIVARTFSDAQLLADHIRDGRAVVLDLRNAESAMVRRLVDFASGLTYGLEGKMVKTTQGVILVTPQGVTIGLDERRRLASMGLYSVADG
jgi:cell division inhibitor SepF